MASEGIDNIPLLGRVASWRRRSLSVQPAGTRLDGASVDAYLAALGQAGPVARALDAAVDEALFDLTSLSSVTSPLALDYLERLARPIPALTPESGAVIFVRSYAAHMALEADPGAYGAADVPVLGTLPPLRRGSPPSDLLTRVVKASRRGFELIRAVSTPVWDGFVYCVTRRVHDGTPEGAELIALDVVEGLARVGWILRQVDIHYGQEPERPRRPAP